MESKDWKAILGDAFNISTNPEENHDDSLQEKTLTAQEQQGKKMIDIILDKKGIFIYKSTVKVALSRGIPAFDETINFLKNMKPIYLNI